LAFLSIIPDPRMARKRKHPLINVLVIAVCAAICGAETWMDIEDFGESKLEWFSQFLDMSNGVPSHDTFARVFAYLNPADFHEAFYAWVSAVNAGLLEKGQIAIDGKTLRRSFDRANQKSAIHMVNAWSHSASLVLGQIKTESKSNEITAIPKLLDMLNVKGCIVSRCYGLPD
jgi:predicted transposase YbfD/YdcC